MAGEGVSGIHSEEVTVNRALEEVKHRWVRVTARMKGAAWLEQSERGQAVMPHQTGLGPTGHRRGLAFHLPGDQKPRRV